MKEIFDKSMIENIIGSALDSLNKNDEYLIKNQIMEMAICHRFAIYLENEFRKNGWCYHIDIEYNKHGQNHKELSSQYGSEKQVIRPDIIIHRRGDDNENLLYIECKKSKVDDNDRTKTDMVLKEFSYKYSCLVSFNESEFILKS